MSCSCSVVDGEPRDGGDVVAHEEREQLSEGEVEVPWEEVAHLAGRW